MMIFDELKYVMVQEVQVHEKHEAWLEELNMMTHVTYFMF